MTTISFPRRIFQTWKNKTIYDNKLLKEWSDTWKKNNPSFDYEIWDDTDNRSFIEQNYPFFLSIYDEYDANIKRVDAVRYFYLLKYGGIYADLDFECLKSFENLLKWGENTHIDIILGQLGPMDHAKNTIHIIPNALMIAKANCDFIDFVIKTMINTSSCKNLGPEFVTGPALLTLCFDAYNNNVFHDEFVLKTYKKNIFDFQRSPQKSIVILMPPTLFYPINWDNKESLKNRLRFTNEEAIKRFPESLAVTYWLHSWEY